MSERKDQFKKETYSKQEEQLAETINAIMYPNEEHEPDQTLLSDPTLRKYAQDTKKLLDTVRPVWQAAFDAEERAARERIKGVVLQEMRKLYPKKTPLRDRILAFITDAMEASQPVIAPAYRMEEVPTLTQHSGDSVGQSMPLSSQTTLIGRDPNAYIHITDEESTFVGRRHAEITLTQQGYAIKDLESTNGTKLNGEQLNAGVLYRLVDGDRIQIADVEFKFDHPSQST